MKTVFFPGSFNPFTKGHADIVERVLKLADHVVIGVGFNSDKPHSWKLAEEMAAHIRTLYSSTETRDRISVVCYEGLTALAARKAGADCMVRGVRNAVDFDYEYTLAAANRHTFGIETILLPADPALGYVSSTLVRDLLKYGDKGAAKDYLP